MPYIDPVATGKNIKNIMIKNGKTVKDVRDMCGLESTNSVYKWLNAQSLPTIDNLVILAHGFGVTVDDLLVLTREE